MIIEHIMHKKLHTLLPTHSLQDAVTLMKQQDIRHIPIVDETFKLVGIVTAHDVKRALPSTVDPIQNETVYETPLAKIMTENPIVGHPLDFVEDIAATLYDAKISCMPIVSQQKLVGLITTTDLLYAFIELTGSNKPSSKIDILVEDRPGVLNAVTDIIKEFNANILSILVLPKPENSTMCVLSIRLQMIHPLPIIEHLKAHGYEVLWPSAPGMIL